MKLDPAALRYLSDDDFRVLTAVEMGMRNHELVPIPLISAISGLRHGGYMRSLKQIHKNKLVHKESKNYVGFRLTNLGYDYLALRALVKRGVIDAIGRSLGVGKEADVFTVTASEQLTEEQPDLFPDEDSAVLAMKLHRLGRTSFRAVKSKRDYLVHRKSASWIYFSRLAAMKEYAFMCALHQRGFPAPRPFGQSRHIVVMELCKGALLTQVRELENASTVANELLGVAVRFAKHGLIHCDLNEFNVLIDDDGTLMVIDFPQMVSTKHADAEMFFDRDIDGIRKFFEHRFGVKDEDMIKPLLQDVIGGREEEEQIDTIVAASGFRNMDQEGKYGVQDLGAVDEEGARQVGEDLVKGIDISSLQISVASETSREGDGGDDEDDEDDDDGNRQEGRHEKGDDVSRLDGEGGDTEGMQGVNDNGDDTESIQSSSLNYKAIESRVRRQRANQHKRRQFARRNIVKDSEKRKVKAEVGSEMWQ